ncbi:MAG: flavoprotein [Planctomycetota bacterium]|jgi:phosphopantothenoylcysteine decarboxylase/phosphopantothenate--cysteine ligase
MPNGKSKLEGLNILLGVSGGVAAYKAVDLASRLTAGGARVKTVMTENACQLVGPNSFEAVTRTQVSTNLWGTSEEYKTSHIALAEWADVIVVAPATANIIGKFANGICDDLLSTLLCTCWAKPTLFAPAMNSDMWNSPAVQRNVETAKETGLQLIGPEKGRLACGTEGIGRMSEPQDILQAIERIASKVKREKK